MDKMQDEVLSAQEMIKRLEAMIANLRMESNNFILIILLYYEN